MNNIPHHKVIQELVSVLCNKTQNEDKNFFQVEVAYFICKIASCMRAYIKTRDRGNVPINCYAIALASSGFGKGYSVSFLENEVFNGFKNRFVHETMPQIARQHLVKLGTDLAIRKNMDPNAEVERLERAYERCGAFPFTFDSGTAPAVKQLREKLLLASCGAINLQIDEIGSNLIGATEVLNTFLELYDNGLLKQKLVKNTAENIRADDLEGKTPANMLLFGTPVKLFDGSSTENEFYSFLETGYARRCLFGCGNQEKRAYHQLSAADIFKRLTDSSNNVIVTRWNDLFTELADSAYFNIGLDIDDDVSIKLLEYKIQCERIADSLGEYEEIRKSELSHRYFKALKLAGAYAFIDRSSKVTELHLQQAIKLVEESGQAFSVILMREKSYMKLAKYIASCQSEVTHADLTEALPFYKTGQAARTEQMSLAIAWGYRQHIVIKKRYADGIEFFSGSSLKTNDLQNLILSYSDYHVAQGYEPCMVPFDSLKKLALAANDKGEPMHWCNHHFVDNYRCEANAIPGFNFITLDIDGGISLETAKELLKKYTFCGYTTKRHTEKENRFRIMIPINYTLELDSDDYKEFMNNIIKWLPFSVDTTCNQRSKKWLSNPSGSFFSNEAEILDAVPFIPRTSKNDKFLQDYKQIESMENLERWFFQQIAEGNRNNNLIKYALILVDEGKPLVDIYDQISNFNSQLTSPLSDQELSSTVFKTVAKRVAERDGEADGSNK